MKGKERERIGIKLKRRIITALLDGMEAHLGDDTMMRNGCLTLCQFKIPTDVVSFSINFVMFYILNHVTKINHKLFTAF